MCHDLVDGGSGQLPIASDVRRKTALFHRRGARNHLSASIWRRCVKPRVGVFQQPPQLVVTENGYNPLGSKQCSLTRNLKNGLGAARLIAVTGTRINPSTWDGRQSYRLYWITASALAYGPAANQPRTVRSFAENQVGSSGIIRK